METIVRPSADLRNHYNEISQECHEREHRSSLQKMEKVIRLLWGYKTIIRCSQNWNYCVPWQKRKKMLSRASCTNPQTFNDIRNSLLERK